MKSSKLLCVLLAALTGLAVLTASVAVPILCRPFYYAHIGPLKLEEHTGLTEAEIKTAFDEMLDYCLGAEEFSTGVLAWSEEGKAHFTDVRGLFLLDLRVLGAALCLLAAVLLYARFAGRAPARPLGRGVGVWAWGAGSCWWARWPRWTSDGPSCCSTPCSSPARTTGCLTPGKIRSSASCPRNFSGTAPCSSWPC